MSDCGKKFMFWSNIMMVCSILLFIAAGTASLIKWEKKHNQKEPTEYSEHIIVDMNMISTNSYLMIKIKDNNILTVKTYTIISEYITLTNEYTLPKNGYILVTAPKR